MPLGVEKAKDGGAEDVEGWGWASWTCGLEGPGRAEPRWAGAAAGADLRGLLF